MIKKDNTYIEKIENRLKINIRDKELYSLALMHPSYINTIPENRDKRYTKYNVAMGDVGECVFQLIVIEFIFYNYSQTAGEMSEMSIMISTAVKKNFCNYYNLTELIQSNIHTDPQACEQSITKTILGAVYNENGLDKIRDLLFPICEESVKNNKLDLDWKTVLQEYAQMKVRGAQIEYQTISLADKGAGKTEAIIDVITLGKTVRGVAQNKKLAGKEAAKNYLFKYAPDYINKLLKSATKRAYQVPKFDIQGNRRSELQKIADKYEIDINLLQQSLMTSSYVNENKKMGYQDNQGMSLYGKHLIEVLYAELLFKLGYGKLSEYNGTGNVINIKARSNERISLHDKIIATDQYNLYKKLLMAMGQLSLGPNDKIKTEACYAFWSGIYITKGKESFLEAVYQKVLAEGMEECICGEFESKQIGNQFLNDFFQKSEWGIEIGFIVDGPPHEPIMTCIITVITQSGYKKEWMAQGSKKREAKSKAANMLYSEIKEIIALESSVINRKNDNVLMKDYLDMLLETKNTSKNETSTKMSDFCTGLGIEEIAEGKYSEFVIKMKKAIEVLQTLDMDPVDVYANLIGKMKKEFSVVKIYSSEQIKSIVQRLKECVENITSSQLKELNSIIEDLQEYLDPFNGIKKIRISEDSIYENFNTFITSVAEISNRMRIDVKYELLSDKCKKGLSERNEQIAGHVLMMILETFINYIEDSLIIQQGMKKVLNELRLFSKIVEMKYGTDLHKRKQTLLLEHLEGVII